MAYDRVNKKYICDYCGNVMHLSIDGWEVGNGHAKCPMCVKKDKFMKEQTKYMRKQERQAKRVDRYYSSSDITFMSVLWFIIKWMFCMVWGGPWLIYKGIRERKYWISIIGAEFTTLTGVFIYLTNTYPEYMDVYNEELPLHTLIMVVLMILNIIFLIIVYIGFRGDDDY